MKTKQFWFNLPVENLEKSKEFYRKIGFTESDMQESHSHMGRFFIGEQNVGMMLFPKSTFQEYTIHQVTDTSKSSEVLLNIDAQSKEEVEEYAHIAREAGGTIYLKPILVQGWMYTCGFTDLDGHRWNVLYMDMERIK